MFELQRLSSRHHRMVDLHLEGVSHVEIAQIVGVTRESVGLVINSPLTQDEIARRRAVREHAVDDLAIAGVLKARSILDEAAEEAATTQVDLLGSGDDRTRLAASKEILGTAFGSGKDGEGGGVIKIEQATIQNIQIAVQESRAGRKQLDESEETADSVGVHIPVRTRDDPSGLHPQQEIEPGREG